MHMICANMPLSNCVMRRTRYKKTQKRRFRVIYNVKRATKSACLSPCRHAHLLKIDFSVKLIINSSLYFVSHIVILKKRPSVCQFASPLDVDLHNTPQVSFYKFLSVRMMRNKICTLKKQAIILEGKYWKRKWKVITAEYKKWRRYNVTKALGTSNILDTVSLIF